MSASVSLGGALPAAASGSHRRIPRFSSIPFNRCLRSFTYSTSRNANVVRATTAGEDSRDGAPKAPPWSPAAGASPKGEGIGGVGFGSGRSGGDEGKGSRKKRVVRRTPVQKPLIQSAATATATEKDDGGALPEQEKAFVLVWLGLGLLILVEGIALAASVDPPTFEAACQNSGLQFSPSMLPCKSFLPDEWDKLFVKYLYPSFTPTVVLFLGGTVAYGVFKYLKAGESKS